MQKVETEFQVVSSDTAIRLENLRLTDREVVSILNECQDQAEVEELVKQAIKIGLLAIRNGNAVENIDYIEKNIAEFGHQVQKELDGVKSNMADYFGPKGTVPMLFDTRNKQGLATSLLDEINKQIQQLLNASNDQSSMGLLRRDLEKNFGLLFGAMNQLLGKKEEAQKGSQKGVLFEEELYDYLQALNRVTGDSIEKTGSTARGRDKKGDLVIKLTEPGLSKDVSIVVEAKDTGFISVDGKNGLLSQVEQGMVNRTADFGLGVVKDPDSLPQYMGPLRYYPDKNIIICSFGDDGTAVELAYVFARTMLLTQAREEVESEGIDVESIEGIFNDITRKLKVIKTLKKNMTEIEKITGSTRTELDALNTELKDLVQEGLDYIQGTVEE